MCVLLYFGIRRLLIPRTVRNRSLLERNFTDGLDKHGLYLVDL